MNLQVWPVLRRGLWSLPLLLSACVSAPSIPETTWHRLPAAADVAPISHPSAVPVAVHRFEADGLYADQALLYALDAKAQQLRAYHYHQWIDPPGTLLQRRWIGVLQQAQAASQIVERSQAGSEAWQLRGRIERWERVPTAAGDWQVQVALELRLQRGRDMPLLRKHYSEVQTANDASLEASVQAMGEALDRIQAAFLADLTPLLATESQQ